MLALVTYIKVCLFVVDVLYRIKRGLLFYYIYAGYFQMPILE